MYVVLYITRNIFTVPPRVDRLLAKIPPGVEARVTLSLIVDWPIRWCFPNAETLQKLGDSWSRWVVSNSLAHMHFDVYLIALPTSFPKRPENTSQKRATMESSNISDTMWAAQITEVSCYKCRVTVHLLKLSVVR